MYKITVMNQKITTNSEVIDKKGIIQAINTFFNCYGEPDVFLIERKDVFNEKTGKCAADH